MASTASQPTTPEAGALLQQAQAKTVAEPTAQLGPAERHAMIAEAAFFRAQKRGFTPCQEIEDWLAAEREIEEQLAQLAH